MDTCKSAESFFRLLPENRVHQVGGSNNGFRRQELFTYE